MGSTVTRLTIDRKYSSPIWMCAFCLQTAHEWQTGEYSKREKAFRQSYYIWNRRLHFGLWTLLPLPCTFSLNITSHCVYKFPPRCLWALIHPLNLRPLLEAWELEGSAQHTVYLQYCSLDCALLDVDLNNMY